MRSPRGTALEGALLATLGGDGTAGAPFATDGGELERAGIASLICGPGEIEQAHQPNESVSRAAFERGVAVIQTIIGRLCRS
jgi:acetylornithine deacetylase